MPAPSFDMFVNSLTDRHTAPAPKGVRTGVTGRPGVVRGLSFREIVGVAMRHPEARDSVWRRFGLSKVPPAPPTVADVRALFDVLCTALGSRSAATRLRLVRLPPEVFDDLEDLVVSLTVPHPDDVDHLFKPPKPPDPGEEPEEEPEDDDDVGPWTDAVVYLGKLVMELTAKGFDDPASWTPGRILFTTSVVSETAARKARAALVDAAVASRLGNVGAEAWRQAVDKIRKG